MDAHGCDADALRDSIRLSALFERLVVDLQLTVIGAPLWHRFPAPGGLTGLALLSESHLTLHTFPELGFAALNVYCCRIRPTPDFGALLRGQLGARDVTVRTLPRGEAAQGIAP